MYDHDDDYPLIPRNTPVRGMYWGMDRKEVILWVINAAIVVPIVFSHKANAEGILWFIGGAAYLGCLKVIFSHHIAGRVMWRYAADLYSTIKAPKCHYYFEQVRGEENNGFTVVERSFSSEEEIE